MNKRFKNAQEFVASQVIIKNNDVIDEIAWKFTIGDVILSIADQAGFKGLEPGNNIEVYQGDGTDLDDIMIGDSLCILVRSANKENLTSEDDSSESQPNPDKESEDLGFENS